MTNSDIVQLRQEVNRLKREVKALTEVKPKDNLSIESFKANNSLVNFYTELPNWDVSSVVFEFVKGELLQNSSLTSFHQFQVVFQRIRLGLTYHDLGYRLGVHISTISHIFSQTIEVLYVKLKHLIVWPERHVLLFTMPTCFRKHCTTCVIIIDCFEVFQDRPTNLLARAQTYLAYKHHNAVK